MSEKEQKKHSQEQHTGHERVDELVEKQHELIRERLERAEREHKERASSEDALEQAKNIAETSAKEVASERPSPAERRRGPITKKQLDNSFASQMSHARDHMSPSARIFSRIIHSKPIETASDLVASTIARPNALLAGSITAFASVTLLYFLAKHYGFSLSGFETIGAFIIGWTVGILYDYFSVMIRGHK